jgi:hypothetical protein
MEHRLGRTCLVVLSAIACLLVMPAVGSADDAAPAAVNLFAAPAAGCLAQTPALPAPAAEAVPEADLFQESEPADLPDNGLQLASSSCPCPIERVGKKCLCPNCSWLGTCQLFAGNPVCLTACAD